MHKTVLNTLVIAGLSVGGASFAQENTDTNEDTPKTEEDTNSQDQTFPVAEDANNQIGLDYIVDTQGDWQVVCTRVPEGQRIPCRLYQLMKDKDETAVAEMSIVELSKAEKAVAGVNFITPLGTLLTAQVGMRVDSGQAKAYPFSWCEKQGCVTRFGLTEAELANLKKGSKAVMSITAVAAPKDPISLDLSLSGFTAAWDALNSVNSGNAAAVNTEEKAE